MKDKNTFIFISDDFAEILDIINQKNMKASDILELINLLYEVLASGYLDDETIKKDIKYFINCNSQHIAMMQYENK